ncbi:MAG: HAD-IIB family hydrolase [Deltaproteobacteria bacterium]|nr:HAD-IIB family hydrolase [Deltaproteobacteria bacterium]
MDMRNSLKRPQSQILIFTDLDSTLLDDQTYDFSPAVPALKIIHSRKIPLILVSSKTRAEIEFFRELLSLESPFIAENGGGIYFPTSFALPKEYSYKKIDSFNALIIGEPIKEVLRRGRRLKRDFNFRGFSEMPAQEIASLTGLTLEQALLASKREFDEPIILQNPLDDKEIFCKKALQYGLDCVYGGRFIHLFVGGNKGGAVKTVLKIYRQLKGPIFSIALGDSPNDISMLKAVDKAVLMQSRDGTHINGLAHPDLIALEGNGPETWNRVMLSILEDLRNRKLMAES